MQALYTMVFDDFLAQFEDSADWARVIEKFEQFPSYRQGTAPELTVYTLFKNRFKFREIGAETPSLFAHFCEDRAQELYVKYSWKLDEYNKQYQTLMERSTSLASSGNDDVYLFPINSNAQKLASRSSFERNTQAIISAPSNPELLELVFKVRDIYIDLLDDFEPLFLGVY